MYPATNGVKSLENASIEIPSGEDSGRLTTGTPPPIDAVDIGIVPEEVARMAQEGGPPPRNSRDINVPIEDNEGME